MRAAASLPSLLLALALSACAAPVVSLAPPAHPASAKEYRGIYDRWTRTGRALSFSEFDTTLVVSATLRSAEFQDAYTARYLKVYALSGPEADALRASEARRASEGYSFAVQAVGHNYGWVDLSTTRALWRVWLQDDTGHAVAPTSVEMVRNRQALETALFEHPLAGPYARAFHLTFPQVRADGQPLVGPGTRRLTLTFAGPQGRIDLHWTLR